MEKIVSVVSSLPTTKVKNDDDFTDRLSSRYTVVNLVVFALVVSMHQYVGTPITCWVPVHFTGSHTKYTNSYCWVRNTYYLPYENEIPKENQPELRQVIPYYQWIPFILLCQAFLFYFPSVVWHAFNSKAGVDADNILETASTFTTKGKQEEREKTLDFITNQISRFLTSRKDTAEKPHFDMKHILSATCCRLCGTRYGNYLVILYLFSKVLYIANVIGQLFILNGVLGTRYNTFGMEMLLSMVADHDWRNAPVIAFPRVTMCDLKVRRLGNVHRYTVQCVLPINLYNEKMYIFLWFWMLFVGFLTILSFIVWLLRCLLRSDRVRYVKNHLKAAGRLEVTYEPTTEHDGQNRPLMDAEGQRPAEERETHKKVEDFCDDYMRQDGVFLMRLIGHNTNNITTTEIMGSLWDHWQVERNMKTNRHD